MADDEWAAEVEFPHGGPTEVVVSAADEGEARAKTERIMSRLHRESSIKRIERVPVRAYEREKGGRTEGVRAHTRRQLVRGEAIPEPVFREPRSGWEDYDWQDMVVHVGPEGSGTWVEGTWHKDKFREDSMHPDAPSLAVSEIEMSYAGKPVPGARGDDPMDYHSPPIPADSQEFADAIWAVGYYNNFDPKKVLAAAKKFPEGSLVSVGRESSPVLYVTVPEGYGMHYEMVEEALRRTRPDELQTQFWEKESGVPGESVRAWWD